MANDLEIIKRLKKITGGKLEKLNISEIFGIQNGFVMAANQNVIGLNLHYCYLKDISFLKDLEHLTHLDLGANKIIDLSPLKELNALTGLNLASNQITDLSPLKELKALTGLNLASNKITDLSPLKELRALTGLNLASNQITDLSPLKIRLRALTELYLDSNQIIDLSPLRELHALTILNLASNQITDLSPLKELKNLKQLALSHNQISQLPREILQLNLEIIWERKFPEFEIDFLLGASAPDFGMFLEGNPLETPPVEIVKQGDWAVRNYFKELEKAPVRLLESKLLIVGNGEVGKTTLMRKLKDNNFQVEVGKESTTHGINIQPWEMECFFDSGHDSGMEKVKLHFWDFGGQDIYHATHQFFLTKRSLYLLVWEARKEEESRSFDYWLNIIKLLSADSPVIVVMNKSDVRIKHIDEALFKEKFKNIAAFLHVSCLTGKGIEKLSRQIRLCLNEMPHLHDKLPRVWKQIRDHLKRVKKNYISLNQYFAICRQYGMNEERAEFLSDYLHDLGVILHYRGDQLLENTVILEPGWATEAVYKLVDTREIQENKGKFKSRDLRKYWDPTRFPRDIHLQLIRLMEKFELCFPITGTEFHIVPELLPAHRPTLEMNKYKIPGNLHFQYHYDFMPEGIITRFISRMYYLIEKNHFWKNGVELQLEDSYALVTSELPNRRIKISVTGPCKRELLAVTRNDFEHIHHTLNMEKNQHYNEMLPCTCNTCKEAGEPHLYKYEVLKKFSGKGIRSLHCQVSAEEVTIETLLKGYAPPKPGKDLLKTLITTASQLQGTAKTIRPDENSRNGCYRPAAGYPWVYGEGSNAVGPLCCRQIRGTTGYQN